MVKERKHSLIPFLLRERANMRPSFFFALQSELRGERRVIRAEQPVPSLCEQRRGPGEHAPSAAAARRQTRDEGAEVSPRHRVRLLRLPAAAKRAQVSRNFITH